MSRMFFGMVLGLLLATGCSDGGEGGPDGGLDGGVDGGTDGGLPTCVGSVSDDCAPCFSDEACDGDLYCGGNRSCLPACPATPCPEGMECEDGRCIVPEEVCADIELTLTPVVPDVMILIDRSGSMANSFGSIDEVNVTRWQAVRYALTGALPNGPDGCDADDPVGAVAELEGKVRFSAATYHGGTDCPNLTYPGDPSSSVPAFGRCAEIGGLFSSSPGSYTPTDLAIAGVRTVMMAWPEGTVPAPKVLVLATDGNPNQCNGLTSTETETEAEVAATYAAGITTVVLSVGKSVAADHLQNMANLGVGLPAETEEPDAALYYVATDATALASAFSQIIRGARSCTFSLDGEVEEGTEALGKVRMNGELLAYGTDWVLIDASTLELKDVACNTFKNTDEVSFTATFPCGETVLR